MSYLYTTTATPSTSTAAITVSASALTTTSGFNGTNGSTITIGDSSQAQLHVRGNSQFDGDVTIGGKNIAEALERIEARLNILTPNQKLEAEWEELRLLGEKYRQLEKEMLDQLETVKLLSKKY
jgi:hypothetical protein